MNVLLIGGTGFLGYYAVKELTRRGHTVSILALPPLPAEGLFPPETKILLANLNHLDDDEIFKLLRGQDAVVYAAGADDRITPKAPAYPFFYKHNVEATRRIVSLARQAKVKKVVIMGSYFAYFDRIWPQLKLQAHHPYIRSRVEQEEIAIATAGDEMAVMILELPYIFGSMPGRTPLWKPLIDYIRATPVIFYTHGGTNCIAVEHVAEAISGAVEQGKGGQRYVIGDENLSWVDLLYKLSRLTGKEKKVISLPNWLAVVAGAFIKGLHSMQGKQGGLDPVELIKLQTAMTFFDPAQSRKELTYGSGGLEAALEKTVEACIK
ncbi:MAG: NAD-dependent epimerase/dehydratase family protein [Anaerolineaceae bacterium]